MARPCNNFMNDDSCPYGQAECFNSHHPNIDPGTHATRTHQGYMIPNVKNDACQKCVTNFRQCDKVGRAPGPNDPCSACRHFGGENCQTCVLQPITYNDHAWDQFRQRGGDGYTLADRRSMDDWNPPKSQKSKPKPKPLPMRDELLVSNWQGMSRAALLALPDFLPSGVRDCPRAYCTRPGETRYHEKSVSYLLARDRWLSNGGKRKRDEEDIVEPPSSRPRLGSTTLDASAPAFVQGPRVVGEYLDYNLGQTTYYWSNGWSTVTPVGYQGPMLAPVVPVANTVDATVAPAVPGLAIRAAAPTAAEHDTADDPVQPWNRSRYDYQASAPRPAFLDEADDVQPSTVHAQAPEAQVAAPIGYPLDTEVRADDASDGYKSPEQSSDDESDG